MNPTIEISFKTAQAYSAMCKPLCQELKLPQTAFDILMFLANNPDCTTARDIVEIRKIKANLVSVNVDRLVQEGYLERRAVAGDRRKTQLLCTEKAQPVIARGREVQERFFARLLHNTDAVTREYCNFLCHNVLLNFSLKGLQKRPPPYSAPPGNVFTSQGFSARRFASNSRIASTFEERVMPTSSSPFMIA